MDLKNTINNTNTQKDNIKKVATKIDSKLVELGGEEAIDLYDVPNKMDIMIKENYKKVARIEYRFKLKLDVPTIKVPLNLSFKPSMLFIKETERRTHWVDNINKSSMTDNTDDGHWSSYLEYAYKSHTSEYLILKVLKHTEIPPDHREYSVSIICVE